LLLLQWLQLLPARSNNSRSTFAVALHTNPCSLVSYLFLLREISIRRYCLIHQYARFLPFFFNYYIRLICRDFSVCVYPLSPFYYYYHYYYYYLLYEGYLYVYS
jgi:hypothetical protein